jgi:gliding motility-associated-like protein
MDKQILRSAGLFIIVCIFSVPGTTSFGQVIPVLDWVSTARTSAGTPSTETGKTYSVAVDASGNSYGSGPFFGTQDFDPGAGVFNLTSVGDADVFITKLDASGNFVWAKSIGGTLKDNSYGIALDPSGNVYVTGSFNGTSDFDPSAAVTNLTSAGFTDLYILKLDTDGNFVWAKSIGGNSFDGDESFAIATDAAGNVFTTGYFTEKVDFDPGPGIFNLDFTSGTCTNCSQIFILKLDTDGNFGWAKRGGGFGDSSGYGISVDASGNVLTTGYFWSNAFGAPSTGTQDIFIVKHDNNGNQLWAKAFGDATDISFHEKGYAITTDASGNVYATGRYENTTDFDPGAGVFNLTAVDKMDIFVLKLDAAGNFVWAKSMGGVNSGTIRDVGLGIGVDAAGNVYTTGGFSDTGDFDPGPGVFNLTAGIGAIFISKLDSNGDFVWAGSMDGGSGSDVGFSLVVRGPDIIYTAGSFSGGSAPNPFDFDPNFCTFDFVGSGGFYVHKTMPGTLPPAPTISSFSPSSGSVGNTVVITGTNFSTTPANNVVKFFNNRTAVVTASTATSITTTVPTGSTTGKISVTVNCVTVQSATDFTVSTGTQNFITQWNLVPAGSGATQLTFGTATSGTVNYTWQELSPGTASGSGSWSGATLTITGLPAAATIRLQIAPTNFQRLIINNGADRNRITQVEQWGTTQWTSMQRAFRGCTNLQVTATDTPNLSGVTNVSEMFSECTGLNSPSNIGTWNTSTVTDMSFMFYLASAFNQNIGTWNTSAVTNMSTMFSETNAFNQNIGAWNTASVTNMNGMFDMASAFNQNIGGWNTGAVTNMNVMFRDAVVFNQNIGAWNTGAVTDMRTMFSGATVFNQNLGAWTLNSAVDLRFMFDNSGVDCSNYSSTLIGWNANPTTPNGRTLVATARQYGTNAVVARTNLISTKGWSITGDTPSGVVCSSVTTPTITSFSPVSGPIGTSVTITGTNFSTTLVNNIVYFGATRATVTAATSTQLTVSVPTGATYQSISVLVNGLTAFSAKPFTVTFADGGIIDACSFAPKVDFTSGINPYTVAIGDIDNDGKPDLAIANAAENTISIFKNISTTGSITTSSFAPRVNFMTGTTPRGIFIKDLDGDGKPEIGVANNGSNTISIFQNTSATGVINISSLAPKIDFATGLNPHDIAIHDFDADGKPDLAVTNNLSNSVSVLKNTSITGSITTGSFAAKVDFTTGSGPQGIASWDIDGDGKADLVITNEGASSVSVLRNTASIGTLTVSSFAAKVDFAVGPNPTNVAIADLDADGKPDLAVTNADSGTVSVLQNTSTSGAINASSFSTQVEFFSGGGYGIEIDDLDGDGKPDIVTNSNPSKIAVLKNQSNIGTITNTSFAFPVEFAIASNIEGGLAIGDFDGDGKPDIVASGGTDQASILRNTVSSLTMFTSSGFSPTTGAPGTVVTFTGTNFSTTPLNNTIKFNGVTALVTSSTSTSITAIVPAGATTGPVSIQIGCITALSIIPFTVTAGSAIAITTQPSDTSVCTNDLASFTTSVTGTTNITYQWQFSPNTGTFSDINNGSSYSGVTSSTLSVNTTNSFGAGQYRCRVNGDLATEVITNSATLSITNCNGNQPPVILPSTSSVIIEGVVTINLVPLISDPDDNLDLQSLQLVSTASQAGASASINSSFELTLDYGGALFSGNDFISISVCDVLNECIEQELTIEVVGDIVVYNAISPNNDSKNEILYLKYIDVIPQKQNNVVSIYNRWGSKVFEVENYNNDDRVFKGLNDNGNELPSGTYFYKIIFTSNQTSEEKEKTGYLVLKR